MEKIMEKKHIISLGGELASRKRHSIKNINAKTKLFGI